MTQQSYPSHCCVTQPSLPADPHRQEVADYLSQELHPCPCDGDSGGWIMGLQSAGLHSHTADPRHWCRRAVSHELISSVQITTLSPSLTGSYLPGRKPLFGPCSLNGGITSPQTETFSLWHKEGSCSWNKHRGHMWRSTDGILEAFGWTINSVPLMLTHLVYAWIFPKSGCPLKFLASCIWQNGVHKNTGY